MADRSSPKSLAGFVRRFEGLQFLFDQLPAACIALCDMDLKVVAANRSMRMLLQSGHGSGRRMNLKAFLEASAPLLLEYLYQAVRNGTALHNHMIELEHPNSDSAYHLAGINPIGVRGRKRGGLILMLHDVTETTRLREATLRRGRYGQLTGQSRPMKRVYERIEFLSNSSASVLVVGETGTGKELAARTIHQKSPRAKGPFIALQCSAIPENLIESELFGHEKGAFTGAQTRRVGRFERAHQGTLFLDEIATLSQAVQTKLLRVLDQQVIEPLGSQRSIPVDVRLVSATNQNLPELIAAGDFRKDLYYRLKVVQIKMPPLRARGSDIVLLAQLFLKRLHETHRQGGLELSPPAKRALRHYHWPGNVRELENAIEHAHLHADGAVILPEHLPDDVRGIGHSRRPAQQAGNRVPSDVDHIKAALAAAGGNRSEAARALGVHRSTLWRKMREYRIPKRFGKS